MSLRFLPWVLILLLFPFYSSYADERFFYGLPVHEVFPTPSGIIFPSLLTAAGVNPAALPQRGRAATALGINYSPPPGGSGAHQYSASLGTGDKKTGLGVGYTGSMDNSATHGVFLGGGFRAESTSIGIGFRDLDLNEGGFAPETDLGIIAETGSDVTLGLVLYHLEDQPQLDFGVGFGNNRNYNFEINLLLPPVRDAFSPGANYTITAATTVYTRFFGVSFKSSYQTATSDVNQSVAALVWLMKTFAITIQYSSPNRSYYGMIFLF